MQVTGTEYARVLKGRHLNDSEARSQGAHVEERLDLETSHVAVKSRQYMTPESHEAVAQIGVSPAKSQANGASEQSIAQLAEHRQIGAATALEETGPLRHIGTSLERRHEGADVQRIHGAISIHHD